MSSQHPNRDLDMQQPSPTGHRDLASGQFVQRPHPHAHISNVGHEIGHADTGSAETFRAAFHRPGLTHGQQRPAADSEPPNRDWKTWVTAYNAQH